ncbi:hypothetical protein CSB93_1209 [Pseudomonas paraeruginosa]|uniref:Uncharacterized protein n=1 Tax=Pseudomonas paraeruginosa TaxID=2994495 RepID=A0A2R3J1P9_9PSED|nr:hypothetical protein CSB93_1209 [Pseudomonas paraeruginosa]AWE91295.1 hypothetical protein CSC28_6525 [Pseudomonas paraeruginosa]
MLPYPCLTDASTQGWKRLFYLDPKRCCRADEKSLTGSAG